MSERPCFYSKPLVRTLEKKGCRKEAVWRVIYGEGRFIDVCEEHVLGFRGLGLKIIKLEGIVYEA